MKIKFIKSIFVSFLCLIIFAGCSAVPTSTPDVTPTPTPLEPTPTPIPYGEVLDLNVFLYGTTLYKLPINVQYYAILLEKYSLKVNNVTSIDEADIVFSNIPAEPSKELLFFIDSKSIDLIDYIDEMPNLLALYDMTDIYDAWMYAETWFENNGYTVPKKMDELIAVLIDYKSKNPDAKPIMAGSDNKNEDGYNITELAIALTYGVDLRGENAKNHANYTKAVNAIETVRENDLIEYNNKSYKREYSKYAVYYTSNSGPIPKEEEAKSSWKVFETQLSDSENDVFVSKNYYFHIMPLSGYFYHFYLRENNNPLVFDRLLDYLDWCCTEEGIISSYFGDNYKTTEDGLIDETYYDTFPASLRMVSQQFAETYIFPKYVSESSVQRGLLYEHYAPRNYKTAKALENKALTVIQLADLPEKIDPKDKLRFYGSEIYDQYIKNK